MKKRFVRKMKQKEEKKSCIYKNKCKGIFKNKYKDIFKDKCKDIFKNKCKDNFEGKFKNKCKGEFKVGLVAIHALGMMFLLSSCNVTQLEDRSFPMAIGIDKSKESDGIRVSFDFPDLQEASNEEKESDRQKGFVIDAEEFYKAQKAYENNTNKIIDYNHLKAIVLGREFFSDVDMVRKLFSWLEFQEVLARNTCLFIGNSSAEDMLKLTDETEGSVGKYLEKMVESRPDFKKDKVMTIGKLMNQWHNQNETIFIPVLTDNGGIPSITSYAVVEHFSFIGVISVEDAMKAFLIQNRMEHFDYELADKNVVEIQNITSNLTIHKEQEKAVVSVSLKGEALPKNFTNAQTAATVFAQTATAVKETKQLKYQIEEQLTYSMTEAAGRLMADMGIDIANSYILLGGYNRKLYEMYENSPKEYDKNVTIQFDISITVLN
ncbi:hypothetical protein LQZ18_02285 [Lachnospiraceae bacterium ZAX-1]